ncbi:MAG TPA: RNA methyltransferase [Casimicrobiaceae bacterium]
MRVTSPANARVRDALRLIASSHERRRSGRCVLEGAHLVAVYRARVGLPESIVVTDDALARDDVRALIDDAADARTINVPTALLAEHAAIPADVGILAVVPTPRLAGADTAAHFTLLLEDLQDPGNVGSIVRTAAAAGVDQVLMSKACAFAWSPKVLRAGQGAHFLTSIVEDVDLTGWMASFRAHGGRVAALVVAGGMPLYDADLRGDLAIAVGNEGAGLSAALVDVADLRLTIPMAAGNESLNAAAATAVALFERVRQIGAGARGSAPPG